MNKTRSLLSALALGLSLCGSLAYAHEGHEIDRELLASKIRERGHACASVTSAHEKSENPTVLAVQCSDHSTYRLVISDKGFEVTATTPTTPPTKAPSKSH